MVLPSLDLLELPTMGAMSYKTFKRVLGETSLERKCRWWFGISLGVLLLFSFMWYLKQTNELVEKGNRELGRELVRAGLLEKHFERLGEMEEKLQAGDTGSANETEKKYDRAFYRDFNRATRDLQLGRDFTWISFLPSGRTIKGDKADAEEQKLIEAFISLPSMALEDTTEKTEKGAAKEATTASHIKPDRIRKNADGQRQYLYYYPLIAKGDCYECHSQVFAKHWPDLQEGQLMAVARVTINHEPTVNALATIRALAWGQAVVIGAFSMFSLWAIIRYVIVKPLTHLRDVANAVREGDTAQRAQIRTGDEFEELAAAFNRMLRQLLSHQNELQSVNGELDTRLDELAQANMRLFEMNRLKSDFLATVSHELRTPLNSIIGFSDVLRTIDTLDDKQRRYAGNIQRSGRILLDMIDDILDLAKMESGKMDIKPSEFPLAAIVSAQCDMARPLTEKKNIDLECEVPTDLPEMFQDQTKLQQILNNLLSNAIKFTPEGGRIRVAAQQDTNSDLILKVVDTGIGIREDDQTLVFEKFRQGTSALPGGDAMTREHTGTGLGLSIVRELCRLMGGEVALQSELGVGSTFTVHLPWRIEAAVRLDNGLKDDLEALSRTGVTPPAPSATAESLTTRP